MQQQRTIRKILLVDDDADDRRYFLEALEEVDPDVTCVSAKDGQQALEWLQDLQQELPQLIFLDLRMPRVNGAQCLRAIKADERLKAIPVVIYTTSREERDAEALAGLGAVHFISKPSDPDEIYYLLTLALEERWDGPEWRRLQG